MTNGLWVLKCYEIQFPITDGDSKFGILLQKIEAVCFKDMKNVVVTVENNF